MIIFIQTVLLGLSVTVDIIIIIIADTGQIYEGSTNAFINISDSAVHCQRGRRDELQSFFPWQKIYSGD